MSQMPPDFVFLPGTLHGERSRSAPRSDKLPACRNAENNKLEAYHYDCGKSGQLKTARLRQLAFARLDLFKKNLSLVNSCPL